MLLLFALHVHSHLHLAGAPWLLLKAVLLNARGMQAGVERCCAGWMLARGLEMVRRIKIASTVWCVAQSTVAHQLCAQACVLSVSAHGRSAIALDINKH